MNLITWTFTVIGIAVSLTAALVAIFIYFNRRRRPKARVLRRAILWGLVTSSVVYVWGLFMWVRPNETTITIEEVRKVVESSLQNPEIQRLQRYAVTRGKSVREVLDVLENGTLYDKGLRAFANRDFRAAQRLFERAASEEVDQAVTALYWEGRALTETGERAAAIQAFDRALSLDPTHTETLAAYADVLMALGRFGEAIPLLRRFLVQKPDDRSELCYLGFCLYRTGSWNEAIKYMEMALSVKQYMRTVALRAPGNRPKAGSARDTSEWREVPIDFSSSARFDVSDFAVKDADGVGLEFSPPLNLNLNVGRTALTVKADCLVHLERYGEAVNDFRKLVESEPGDADVVYRYAGALFMGGRFVESEGVFERLAEMKSDDPVVWLQLGEAREALNQVDGALEAYSRVMAVSPNSDPAEVARGRIRRLSVGKR